jgi:hypothetical protein
VPFDERQDICFVGGYQHTPNVDAVEYFVEEILPHVRRQLPDVSFYVIGSNPPARLRKLAGDGVVITGFVEDMGAMLDSIRIAVAPLRYGAGIKGKIATTLASGVPSVASSVAVEGMGLTEGREVRTADDPEAFAQSVVELYTSPDMWTEISRRGVDFARREYGFEAGARIVGGILKDAGLSPLGTDDALAALRPLRGETTSAASLRQEAGGVTFVENPV